MYRYSISMVNPQFCAAYKLINFKNVSFVGLLSFLSGEWMSSGRFSFLSGKAICSCGFQRLRQLFGQAWGHAADRGVTQRQNTFLPGSYR